MFLDFLTSSPTDAAIISDSAPSLTVTPTDVAVNADSGNFLEIIENADPMRFVEMLPKLAMGMISIFIVIGVIIVATAVLNKIFSKKKKDK